MQTKPRLELYGDFIRFIREELRSERRAVNRRMRQAFLWCFALPVVLLVITSLLIYFGFLPSRFRQYQDWVILFFPVFYAAYFLGSEVWQDFRQAIKRGGIATTLERTFVGEAEWREKTVGRLEQSVLATDDDWKFISQSFQMDLQGFRNRNRFLTALAGAVLFLILQVLDVFDPAPEEMGLEGAENFLQNVSIWFASATSQLWQIVVLVLFLGLLYLSNSQTLHSLEKYLNAVELLRSRADHKKPS